MADVYSHGRCFSCKEQHDEKVLTKTPSGQHLCPTCYAELVEELETFKERQLYLGVHTNED